MSNLQEERVARLTVEHQRLASNTDDERVCWICFTTDRDSEYTGWVQPCRCRGSTKWVHQYCVSRWIDEKQRGNRDRSVICPQCQTEYIIFIPEMGGFARLLEQAEQIATTICPYIAGGLFVGSLYWISVTFGAITFVQVLGREKAIPLMFNADRLAILSGLPAIPVALVMTRLVPWRGIFLRMFTNIRACERLLSLFDPVPETADEHAIGSSSLDFIGDPFSTTVVICGALVLPTLSSLVGNYLFRFVGSSVHRIALGGATILLTETVLKLYLRHQQKRRLRNRVIADYNEENLAIREVMKRRLAMMARAARPPSQ